MACYSYPCCSRCEGSLAHDNSGTPPDPPSPMLTGRGYFLGPCDDADDRFLARLSGTFERVSRASRASPTVLVKSTALGKRGKRAAPVSFLSGTVAEWFANSSGMVGERKLLEPRLLWPEFCATEVIQPRAPRGQQPGTAGVIGTSARHNGHTSKGAKVVEWSRQRSFSTRARRGLVECSHRMLTECSSSDSQILLRFY